MGTDSVGHLTAVPSLHLQKQRNLLESEDPLERRVLWEAMVASPPIPRLLNHNDVIMDNGPIKHRSQTKILQCSNDRGRDLIQVKDI